MDKHPQRFGMSTFQLLASSNPPEDLAALSSPQLVSESTSRKRVASSLDVSPVEGIPQGAGEHYGHGKGRKQRAPGTVSLMACSQCRQARQKVCVNSLSNAQILLPLPICYQE